MGAGKRREKYSDSKIYQTNQRTERTQNKKISEDKYLSYLATSELKTKTQTKQY